VAFFRELGVALKREETGKLFPVTDRAQTVLDALLRANREAGVEVRHPFRVETVEKIEGGFRVMGEWGAMAARRLVLATGAPLVLPDGHPLCGLSGVTVPATLQLRSATGRKMTAFTDSTLITHFGLSGPSTLDLSRYWLDARHDDPGAHVTANWLPGTAPHDLDADLQALGTTVLRFLRARLPDRLAPLPPERASLHPPPTSP